ncbi:hypothetical protein FB45DRAFT_1024456 [Roridomyces roridus]|uniref:Uncharacterized protein n=1 Tax=Roridomyces roridus TaxID=1738132 RepID=A0AAD7C1B8_9AGAR|nr:hypothetical protein FB45DRAFT_1024456 [Roridomyces roridus]
MSQHYSLTQRDKRKRAPSPLRPKSDENARGQYDLNSSSKPAKLPRVTPAGNKRNILGLKQPALNSHRIGAPVATVHRPAAGIRDRPMPKERADTLDALAKQDHDDRESVWFRETEEADPKINVQAVLDSARPPATDQEEIRALKDKIEQLERDLSHANASLFSAEAMLKKRENEIRRLNAELEASQNSEPKKRRQQGPAIPTRKY